MRRALLMGVPFAFLSAACTYDNGDAQRVLFTPDCPSTAEAVQAKIDVDSQIAIDAGQGAGVFIEYQSGGHWRLTTSCDTVKTNTSCGWDIIVTPEDGQSLTNIVTSDLEPDDSVLPYKDNVSYRLIATTNADLDGFAFDTGPGAAVRVDAFLDEQCALPYFFWVGDGALHSGSPTNPLILVPTAAQ